MRKIFWAAAVLTVAVAGIAVADVFQRNPVEFYQGHSHEDSGETIGAPQHSVGTDSSGCHNGSVPYHCH